jgi:hypothetical protein
MTVSNAPPVGERHDRSDHSLAMADRPRREAVCGASSTVVAGM